MRRLRPRSIAVTVAAVFLAGAIGVVGLSTVRGHASAPEDGTVVRPNVVVIMTDDQTLESMRVMTNTNRVLGAEGTTFDNYYVSFPNCCPSRATYYTGQLAHNSAVRDNLPPLGGFHKLDGSETLGVWLQRAGYYTASIGKYLNTWGEDGNLAPPPGWSHWFGLIDPSTYHYYNYSVSDDGTRYAYGSEPAQYQTDVLGEEVTNTIRAASARNQPFFVSWTPLSPHAQFVEKANGAALGFDPGVYPEPAPRYKGTFATESAPKSPSWNETDMAGKPAYFQRLPPISPGVQSFIDDEYRHEIETLLATDEWVGRIVSTLRETGTLDNTVIIFTSDNGLFHGEHRIPYGKVFLYEPAVHLPMIIRGPGFPKGVHAAQMTGNVDLAPTVLAITGAVAAGHPLDGTDMRPYAVDPSRGRGRGMLLENQLNQDRFRTSGIHTERFAYLTYNTGETELYDLKDDPDELHNRSEDPALASVKADLVRRLDILKTCKGDSCADRR